jgi:hypothetical protein
MSWGKKYYTEHRFPKLKKENNLFEKNDEHKLRILVFMTLFRWLNNNLTWKLNK